MVWGKKLAHPAWPGQVISVAATGAQFLVSFFGDNKAFSWCDAAQLRPYEPYFPVGELYDGEADDFDAAVDASLLEFSRRVEAALTATPSSPATRPSLPKDFITTLQDLAAHRMGFSNRVQAAIARAHLRAFDKFRGLPDPPEFTLELGLPYADALPPAPAPARAMDGTRKALFNSSSPAPSRRGRKRKEQADEDSDEDWDPRKKGTSDSDSDVGMGRKRASRSSGSGTPRGRPRGRPRKAEATRHARIEDEDEDMEESLDYPASAKMLLQLTSVAADPFNFKCYDSLPVIVSFFSKYKDSEVPSVYDDRELLETLGAKKGRKKFMGGLCADIKIEHANDNDQSGMGDGQRGRRKSAGSLYSARKAEDSYWCDIIISDFDDGDTSSDYEGSKRKRVSQNRSGNKKIKQGVATEDGVSTDTPETKLRDGPTALILHFSNAEAIPSVDDINNIFRIHGPIVELETQITRKAKMAKVVFSKRADAEQAYSSSGKYNAFGPALLKYELKYVPSAPQVL